MSKGGRLLIFTGDGKGKTTAALGMVLRAAGHGQRVLVVQFIKSDSKTGELASCKRLPGIEIVQMGQGFVRSKTNPHFDEHRASAQHALEHLSQKLLLEKFDLLVLDEVCVAVALGLVSEEQVLNIVKSAPKSMCVVMTGRGATPGLIAAADTVTEMKCVKHAYARGVKAQAGVEY